MSDSPVTQFEQQLAEFFNAPYAVAVDCCTHAVELSLRYLKSNHVTCPAHTYISIPYTLEKLALDWTFETNHWEGYYYIGNTPVIDAATYWKQNSYVPGSFMCLSFQFKKHLNLCKGGAILVDNYNDWIALKKLAHDGRIPDQLWKDQKFDSIGYHYYMPIETALLGIERLPAACATPARVWTWEEYPYLPDMPVFAK